MNVDKMKIRSIKIVGLVCWIWIRAPVMENACSNDTERKKIQAREIRRNVMAIKSNLVGSFDQRVEEGTIFLRILSMTR